MAEKTIKFEKKVANGSSKYIVVKEGGIKYEFGTAHPRHLKPGDFIKPVSEEEIEYCANLEYYGALKAV